MVERDDVRRAYDELADVYAAERAEDDRGTEILEGFLGPPEEPSRVLDAGCGGGTPVLSRPGGATTAVGVDLSRGQLRLAAENASDARLVQGDMVALPFRTGSFDAVVAYWSLIHVPMEDHPTVIEEFARVVRPGGRLLLCEGTDEWVGRNPDWLGSGVGMAWNIAGASATREQLRDAGFAVVDSWKTPSSLEADREDDDDRPWTFFSARLES